MQDPLASLTIAMWFAAGAVSGAEPVSDFRLVIPFLFFSPGGTAMASHGRVATLDEATRVRGAKKETEAAVIRHFKSGQLYLK